MQSAENQSAKWPELARKFNALGGRQCSSDGCRHRWARIEKDADLVNVPCDKCAAAYTHIEIGITAAVAADLSAWTCGVCLGTHEPLPALGAESLSSSSYDHLSSAAAVSASRSSAGKSPPWSTIEDADLRRLVEQYGGGNWELKAEAFFKMPGHSDTLRSAKSLSCRFTILNKLDLETVIICDGCEGNFPLSQTGTRIAI